MKHLGLPQNPEHSVMMDGNKKRNHKVFEMPCHGLLTSWNAILSNRHQECIMEEIKSRGIRVNRQ